MKKAKIDIVAPSIWVRLPEAYDWTNAVDVILKLNEQISIKTVGDRIVKISISVLSNSAAHNDYFKEVKPKKYPGNHIEYFLFSFEVEYEENEAEKYFRCTDMTIDNACYLCERNAVGDLVKNVIDIGIAANIAMPGSFNAKNIHSFVDSEYKQYISKSDTSYYLTHKGAGFEDLHEVVSIDKRETWPPIQNLEIIQVYNWIAKIDGFEFGVAKTPLGVSYAAFSYLMGDLGENSKSSILWALMALEALYCEGSTSLRQQLVAKTEVFLGKRQTHKKRFGAMYDYRSRLIHGDINIVYRHHQYDGSKEQGAFDDEFYQA